MKKPIVIIGSANMDLIVKTTVIPQAGQTVRAEGFLTSPGGKGANQAVAVARLGGAAAFVGKVGSDAYGDELIKSLTHFGIDTANVMQTGDAPTGVAVILLEESGENRIIVAPGANDLLLHNEIHTFLTKHKEAAAVLLQLEIPIDTVKQAIATAKTLGIPVIIDAGPALSCDLSIFQGVDILSPNQTEIQALTGCPAATIEEAYIACGELLAQSQAKTVVLKMGSQGCLVCDSNQSRHFPAFPIEPVDTTAAGDGFTAALAVGVQEGWTQQRMIDFANATGALTATRIGAYQAIPSNQEVMDFLRRQQE